MSKNSPHVSVLLPVFNGMPWVAGAMDSILAQTYQDWELIVVDDGSTDASGVSLRRYTDPRIRVLRHEENQGLVAALNTGLAACRGEWVARMDADDVSFPERLERQVRFLELHPTIGVLGTWWKLTDASGNSWVQELPEEHEAIEWQLLFSYSLVHATTISRKQLLVDAGGYDPAFSHVEDIDLWTRMLRKGVKFANLPDVLYEGRLHGASVCARYSGIQCQRYRVLRERMLFDWFQEPSRELDISRLAKVLSGAEVLFGPEIWQAVDLLLDLLKRFMDSRTVSEHSREQIRKILATQIVDVSQRNGYIHPKTARQWWRWIIPESMKRALRRWHS